MSDCPYGECPRYPEMCDCWIPGQVQSHLEPCEACWIWSDEMKRCDGCCEGHGERDWKTKMGLK